MADVLSEAVSTIIGDYESAPDKYVQMQVMQPDQTTWTTLFKGGKSKRIKRETFDPDEGEFLLTDDGKVGFSHGGSRKRMWTSEAVLQLVELMKEYNGKPSRQQYKDIANQLSELIPSITVRRILSKWDGIKRYYYKYEECRRNNLTLKLRKPLGYELLKGFVGKEKVEKEVNPKEEQIQEVEAWALKTLNEDDNLGYNSFDDNDYTPESGDIPWNNEMTLRMINLVKLNYKSWKQKDIKKHLLFGQIHKKMSAIYPGITKSQIMKKWEAIRTGYIRYETLPKSAKRKPPAAYDVLKTFMDVSLETTRSNVSSSTDHLLNLLSCNDDSKNDFDSSLNDLESVDYCSDLSLESTLARLAKSSENNTKILDRIAQGIDKFNENYEARTKVLQNLASSLTQPF